MTLQGQQALAEQQKLVAAVLEMAFPIALGGHDASDTQPGWGRALAEKSRQTGLRACGAVVYREASTVPVMMRHKASS